MCTSVDVGKRRQELQTGKAKGLTELKDGTAENGGGWIYESRPLNLSGPGEYDVVFGPLDAEFDYPKSPTGVSLGWPPDFQGKVTPVPGHGPAVFAENGTRWLRVPLTFSDVGINGCRNLVVFIL
ncbi:hypothetical protein ACFPIJ_45670 [Dactylosporangium cerinum]|uniref:Uncharacterized protein n=1 Tax=Dactylosporangium cerinum TaxID=1434730 RepID=A0ABV9WC53_9ACTN